MLRFFKRRKEKERLEVLEQLGDIDTDAIARKEYKSLQFFGRTHQSCYLICKHCKGELVFYQESVSVKIFRGFRTFDGIKFTVCSSCGKLETGWESK